MVLGHRRLAVIDLTPAAAQPMVTPDGLHALSYNGEVYNDADLRAELGRENDPPRWRSRSDGETLLHLLARHGPGALSRVRGMYALAFHDASEQRLVLARDPMGIKPLHYATAWCGGAPEIVFASEAQAVASHPRVGASPDLAGISVYLSTIRTVLGDRTLFAGVKSLRPGEVLEFDLGGGALRRESRIIAMPAAETGDEASRALGDAESRVREVVSCSIRAHLRSDAPLCLMLSGGLDSTIIAAVAGRHHADLRSYCSGAACDEGTGDSWHARLVAAGLGLRHTDAPVSAGMFGERWAEMVARSGVPLSTPNEVAINEVCRRMRRAGEVVTLSGEGADELFGGYEGSLREAAAFEASAGARATGDGAAGFRAEYFLRSASWVPPEDKPGVLSPAAWRALEGDVALLGAMRDEFAASAAGAPDPLAVHLRCQRRVNLTGLLHRLDSASMLESIEGRTPFADVCVAALAESLPTTLKFVGSEGGDVPGTKLVLRRAFASEVPAAAVTRPKASFPLPFQAWMAGQTRVLERSEFVRELFLPEAIAVAATDPARHWRLAWPMMNLAMWRERWG